MSGYIYNPVSITLLSLSGASVAVIWDILIRVVYRMWRQSENLTAESTP